ncbi:AHH domain-containing protein [Rummeliibacillus sp. SL167]|uniref:AHH domain-containing protein n=1 Tax=Rummeliibacillus sp. SL167 TaxID=2579792 RepID=UPI0011B738A7
MPYPLSQTLDSKSSSDRHPHNWNKELLPHQGRHPNAYHEYVLERLRTFDKIAKGDKEKFLKLYEQLKQKVRENPDMLYKDYWRKQ